MNLILTLFFILPVVMGLVLGALMVIGVEVSRQCRIWAANNWMYESDLNVNTAYNKCMKTNWIVIEIPNPIKIKEPTQ